MHIFMILNLRRLFLLGLILAVLTFLSLVIISYYQNEKKICFSSQAPALSNFSSVEPQENSIFFFQTSCKSVENGKIVISPKEACAVEAAANLNKYFDVYVLYLASGVLKHENSLSDKILEKLITYPNVKILHLDVASYMENIGTKYKISEMSLKFFTLWKFGGISISSDLLLVQAIQNLPKNLAVAKTDLQLGDDFFAFDRVGSGHKLVKRCFHDFKDNSEALTELGKYLCNAETASKMVQTTCVGGFKVFDKKLFYPVPKNKLEWFYQKQREIDIDKMIENSYGVKLWDEYTSGKQVNLRGETSLAWLAKKFCPKVSQVAPYI